MSTQDMSKRYAAEFIGTFLIVFAPCAFSATAGNEGLLAAAIVSGLPVLAAIYALGPISAAHFNPAVTIAFASANRFPWKYANAYIASQLGGAVLAALIVRVLFGEGYGVHITYDAVQGIGTEFLISFFLMFVIMAVATDKRVSGAVPALAIGFTVITGVLIGGNITGGSMNPARSLGPALINPGEALSSIWIYILGPIAGAVTAALLFEQIRIEKSQSQGAPNEILEALEEVAES